MTALQRYQINRNELPFFGRSMMTCKHQEYGWHHLDVTLVEVNGSPAPFRAFFYLLYNCDVVTAM